MQKIPYVNLVAQWEQERDELLPLIDRAMSSGQYIGGKSVILFIFLDFGSILSIGHKINFGSIPSASVVSKHPIILQLI